MADNEVRALNDADVIEVKKTYFLDGLAYPTNVYLRLSQGHYLLLSLAGQKAQYTAFASFMNPLSQIFVEKAQYDTFIKFVTTLTEQIVDKPLPSATKAKFVQGLTSHVMQMFESKKFSDDQHLTRVSDVVMKFAQSTNGFEEVEKVLAQIPNDDAKHSMATCIIAIMIAEEMEFTQAQVFEKLAMAALLHDIGLYHLPNREFLKKPRHEWTAEEVLLYESHPIRGVEALRDLKEVSQDVLLMISEHHENALGTGFPKKIRDVKISPLGRVLIVANYFSDLLFARLETSKNYDAPLAIEFIEEVLGQPFNKQVFRCLKNIIIMDEIKRKQRNS
ncbi:MAG: HD-GYP domain-containing protein [Bdellovibrionales bacterium]